VIKSGFFPFLAIHQVSLVTTYTNLRAWVDTWRPAIIRSVKDAKEQGITNQQAINIYFSPMERNPSDDPHAQSS
jgi:hypothetical protein